MPLTAVAKTRYQVNSKDRIYGVLFGMHVKVQSRYRCWPTFDPIKRDQPNLQEEKETNEPL